MGEVISLRVQSLGAQAAKVARQIGTPCSCDPILRRPQRRPRREACDPRERQIRTRSKEQLDFNAPNQRGLLFVVRHESAGTHFVGDENFGPSDWHECKPRGEDQGATEHAGSPPKLRISPARVAGPCRPARQGRRTAGTSIAPCASKPMRSKSVLISGPRMIVAAAALFVDHYAKLLSNGPLQVAGLSTSI
jgi:hypothetical protein